MRWGLQVGITALQTEIKSRKTWKNLRGTIVFREKIWRDLENCCAGHFPKLWNLADHFWERPKLNGSIDVVHSLEKPTVLLFVNLILFFFIKIGWKETIHELKLQILWCKRLCYLNVWEHPPQHQTRLVLRSIGWEKRGSLLSSSLFFLFMRTGYQTHSFAYLIINIQVGFIVCNAHMFYSMCESWLRNGGKRYSI